MEWKLCPADATMNLKHVEVLPYINWMESGHENVYFLDENGRFSWRAAVRGKSRLERNKNGNWSIPLHSVPPIIADKAADETDEAALAKAAQDFVEHGALFSEFPVVNPGGAVVSCMRTVQSDIDHLSWNVFSKEIGDVLKGKIYLASRENPLLADFAAYFQGKMEMEWLSEQNWETVFDNTTEQMTLLYDVDIYPECHKIGVRELFSKCMESVQKPVRAYCEVEPWAEPRMQILPKLHLPLNEPEMSEPESAFLCGLLRQYRPRKIMEVGLAAGGTSAIILQCLQMIDQPYEMISVDLSERFYKNDAYESGYLGEEAKKHISGTNQKRLLGKLALERISEFGAGVDFLILDTTHVLPGEMLDFLSLLPYLKDGCIVVLHDVGLNFFRRNRSQYSDYAYGNKVIFNTVRAEMKYLPFLHGHYGNIAAFEVDSSTREHIADCFNSLTMTWLSVPPAEQLSMYRAWYKLHYDSDCLWLFDEAVRMNQAISSRKRVD